MAPLEFERIGEQFGVSLPDSWPMSMLLYEIRDVAEADEDQRVDVKMLLLRVVAELISEFEAGRQL